MKGLLLKDILTLYKQTKIILLLMVVFACIPGLPTSAFAVFYGAMMPITALAYDERSKWDELAAMMPYTAKAIVGSKYALGLLLIGSISLLSAASQVVVSVVQHVPLNTETLISSADDADRPASDVPFGRRKGPHHLHFADLRLRNIFCYEHR